MGISAIIGTIVLVCQAVVAVCAVAQAVVSLCKATGLIKVSGDQEQIGERVLAAEEAGITPEVYDNDYDQYMKAVNDFDMTNVDTNKWTKEQKAVKAIELATAVMVNDIGPKAEKIILAIANHADNPVKTAFYSPDRLEKYIEADKAGEIDIEDCLEYMEGKDAANNDMLRTQMVHIEQELQPGLTKAGALDIIDYYRD